MNDNPEPKPLQAVNESAVWGQLAVLARDLLKCAGAGLVTKGILTSDGVEAAAGIAVTVAPMIYSQLKTWWTHRKWLFLAKSQRVPNDLVSVK
jgi:hypothetical protein